jgi:hypothetical protein
MILFENPGEIDIAAISTFGVSVKEGESPIGFFGTGLKYALAILLRNGHRITIWSGLDKYEFATETTAIRGQSFEIVTMNSERLGFTTQVGKTWEMWMAYRELYCNARDEYGEASSVKDVPEPREGFTQIVVAGDEFEAVHSARWQYFIDEAPDIEIEKMQVWTRPSLGFFYRGVRIMKFTRQAMFTYNDTSKLDLTEDRTAKEQWSVFHRIARAMLQSSDEGMLRRALSATDEWMEHQLDFHGWGTPASPVFLKVVGQLANAGTKDLNQTALKVWQEAHPKEFKPREVEMTAVQQETLTRALAFCGKIGFRIDGEYPILIVESLGQDVLGQALDEKIYIAERTFQMGGTKQVVSTLIEEFVHLRYGYNDCERPMQNFLFEKMVSLGEELVGEPV